MNRIVISAVNIIDAGPFTVLVDCLKAFSKYEIEVICIVNTESRFESFDFPNVKFLSYPRVKKRWVYRLGFEYIYSYYLCKKLNPDIWFSIHDMSPFLPKGIKQYVYCHNPSPFYTPSMIDYRFSTSTVLFSLFYKFIYRVNIKSNEAVICQQSWISQYFSKTFSLHNVITAKPNNQKSTQKNRVTDSNKPVFGNEIKIFFPSKCRTFKNFELVIKAVESFNKDRRDNCGIELWLTLGNESKGYEKYLYTKYHNSKCIRFLGFLDKNDMNIRYEACDIFIFPSKLETWGLPIVEAKAFNKPMILADLPYAKETLGSYDQVTFVDVDDFEALSLVFSKIMRGDSVFHCNSIEHQFDTINNWDELTKFVLEGGEIA